MDLPQAAPLWCCDSHGYVKTGAKVRSDYTWETHLKVKFDSG